MEESGATTLVVAYPFLSARAAPPPANATAVLNFAAAPAPGGRQLVGVAIARGGRAALGLQLFAGGLVAPGDVAFAGSAAGKCALAGVAADAAVPADLAGLADTRLDFTCAGLSVGRFTALFNTSKGGARPGALAPPGRGARAAQTAANQRPAAAPVRHPKTSTELTPRARPPPPQTARPRSAWTSL